MPQFGVASSAAGIRIVEEGRFPHSLESLLLRVYRTPHSHIPSMAFCELT
jgi:hypothetical protein